MTWKVFSQAETEFWFGFGEKTEEDLVSVKLMFCLFIFKV